MTREQEMAALLIEDFKRGQVPTCLKGGIRGEGRATCENDPQADSAGRPSPIKELLQQDGDFELSPWDASYVHAEGCDCIVCRDNEDLFQDAEAWEHRYGQ